MAVMNISIFSLARKDSCAVVAAQWIQCLAGDPKNSGLPAIEVQFQRRQKVKTCLGEFSSTLEKKPGRRNLSPYYVWHT